RWIWNSLQGKSIKMEIKLQ
ncbi:hypothetical protein EE612_054196, partial [Oryza sativa]